MDDAEADTVDRDFGLVDVGGLPLSQLVSSEDTVLAHALRRVLADLDQQEEITAAFGNFVPDPEDEAP